MAITFILGIIFFHSICGFSASMVLQCVQRNTSCTDINAHEYSTQSVPSIAFTSGIIIFPELEYMTVAHSTVFQCQSFLPIFIKINRRICIMVARTAENNSPCSFSFVKPISNEFIMAQGITRYTTMIDRILHIDYLFSLLYYNPILQKKEYTTMGGLSKIKECDRICAIYRNLFSWIQNKER